MDAQEANGSGADEAKGKATRARRKPSAKAPPENAKRSLNLRIDESVYERLHVHALRRRVTVSELVSELARANLREFFISRNGGAPQTGDDQ